MEIASFQRDTKHVGIMTYQLNHLSCPERSSLFDTKQDQQSERINIQPSVLQRPNIRHVWHGVSPQWELFFFGAWYKSQDLFMLT